MSDRFHYEALTERECAAIRGAYDGLGSWIENPADMTIRFRDRDGVFEVSRWDVIDYVAAWRVSRLWSLPGREDAVPA